MIIWYARVSTLDQNLALQHDALVAVGCERIFSDKVSGARAKREGLDKAMEILRDGDTLVVWKLDRLGRSLPHLVDAVQYLRDRGVGFRSLQENIDTESATGKLIFHLFASLSEFERDLIRERTLAGLAAARVRGRLGGRPKALTTQQAAQASAMYEAKTIPIAEICQTFWVGKTTLYRYLQVTASRDTKK